MDDQYANEMPDGGQYNYYDGNNGQMNDQYGDEMPPQEEWDGVNALNLQWVLGFNKDID